MRINKIIVLFFFLFFIVSFSFSSDVNLQLKAVISMGEFALCMQKADIVMKITNNIFFLSTEGGNQRYRNYFFMNIETGEVKDFYDTEYNAVNKIVYKGLENGNYIFEEVTDNYRDKIRYIRKNIVFNWEADTHSITKVEKKEENPSSSSNEESGNFFIEKASQVMHNFTPVNLDLIELNFYTVTFHGNIIPRILFNKDRMFRNTNPSHWRSEEGKYITISACIFQDDVFNTVPEVINPAQVARFKESKDRLDQVFLVYEMKAEPLNEEAFIFKIKTGSYWDSLNKEFDHSRVYDRGVVVTKFKSSFMNIQSTRASVWGTPVLIKEGSDLLLNPENDARIVGKIDLNPKKVIVYNSKYDPYEEKEIFIDKEYKELDNGKFDYGMLFEVKEFVNKDGVNEFWYKCLSSEGDIGWLKGENLRTIDNTELNPLTLLQRKE